MVNKQTKKGDYEMTMTGHYSTKSFKIKDVSVRKLRDELNNSVWLVTALYENWRLMSNLENGDYYCVENGKIKLLTEQDITSLSFEIVPRLDNDEDFDDDDAWDDDDIDDEDWNDGDFDPDEPDDGEEDHDWGERG